MRSGKQQPTSSKQLQANKNIVNTENKQTSGPVDKIELQQENWFLKQEINKLRQHIRTLNLQTINQNYQQMRKRENFGEQTTCGEVTSGQSDPEVIISCQSVEEEIKHLEQQIQSMCQSPTSSNNKQEPEIVLERHSSESHSRFFQHQQHIDNGSNKENKTQIMTSQSSIDQIQQNFQANEKGNPMNQSRSCMDLNSLLHFDQEQLNLLNCPNNGKNKKKINSHRNHNLVSLEKNYYQVNQMVKEINESKQNLAIQTTVNTPEFNKSTGTETIKSKLNICSPPFQNIVMNGCQELQYQWNGISIISPDVLSPQIEPTEDIQAPEEPPNKDLYNPNMVDFHGSQNVVNIISNTDQLETDDSDKKNEQYMITTLGDQIQTEMSNEKDYRTLQENPINKISSRQFEKVAENYQWMLELEPQVMQKSNIVSHKQRSHSCPKHRKNFSQPDMTKQCALMMEQKPIKKQGNCKPRGKSTIQVYHRRSKSRDYNHIGLNNMNRDLQSNDDTLERLDKQFVQQINSNFETLQKPSNLKKQLASARQNKSRSVSKTGSKISSKQVVSPSQKGVKKPQKPSKERKSQIQMMKEKNDQMLKQSIQATYYHKRQSSFQVYNMQVKPCQYNIYNIKKDKDSKFMNLQPVLRNRSNSKATKARCQGSIGKTRNSENGTIEYSPNSITHQARPVDHQKNTSYEYIGENSSCSLQPRVLNKQNLISFSNVTPRINDYTGTSQSCFQASVSQVQSKRASSRKKSRVAPMPNSFNYYSKQTENDVYASEVSI